MPPPRGRIYVSSRSISPSTSDLQGGDEPYMFKLSPPLEEVVTLRPINYQVFFHQ